MVKATKYYNENDDTSMENFWQMPAQAIDQLVWQIHQNAHAAAARHHCAHHRQGGVHAKGEPHYS